MGDHPKILKVDHRVWWSIFLIVEAFLVAVIIATLCHPQWVELDPNPNPFNLKFKGSLIQLQDGLSAVYNINNPLHPFDVSGYTYLKVACGVCFLRDQTTETPENSEVWVIYHGWCKMFENIWFTAGLVIVFEVLSLLSLVVISIIIIFFWLQKYFYFKLAYLANGCLCASHYVAIIGWVAISNATFGDDCNDVVRNTDSNPVLCAKQGPKLGLFVIVFLPFFDFPFYLITCCYQKKRKIVPRMEVVSKVVITENNNETRRDDFREE